MKQNKINTISCISYGISILNLIASIVYIAQMPDTVPIHFGIKMSMGSPWYGILAAILPVLIAVGSAVLEKQEKQETVRINRILALTVIMYFVLINWVMLVTMHSGMQPDEQLDSIIFGSFGVLFVIMGNYMPVIQPNKVFGFRIKWTLENETCWRKTHRFAGKLFVIAGLLYLLCLLSAILLHISITYRAVLLFLLMTTFSITSFYAWQHKDDSSI